MARKQRTSAARYFYSLGQRAGSLSQVTRMPWESFQFYRALYGIGKHSPQWLRNAFANGWSDQT